MSENVSLSSKQRRAIVALLTKQTIAAAAKECGISEQTIYRWRREDPNFRQALTEAESDAIVNAARRMLVATDPAITVIITVMATPDIPPMIRLRAAIALIDRMLKLREYSVLEPRVAALEEQLARGNP